VSVGLVGACDGNDEGEIDGIFDVGSQVGS